MLSSRPLRRKDLGHQGRLMHVRNPPHPNRGAGGTMASGPYFDKRRGSYNVQWFDGRRWTRATVYRVPNWKPGRPEPKKVPPEALAALKVYADREKAARQRVAIDPAATV